MRILWIAFFIVSVAAFLLNHFFTDKDPIQGRHMPPDWCYEHASDGHCIKKGNQ